jgi:hypothetical protein
MGTLPDVSPSEIGEVPHVYVPSCPLGDREGFAAWPSASRVEAGIPPEPPGRRKGAPGAVR